MTFSIHWCFAWLARLIQATRWRWSISLVWGFFAVALAASGLVISDELLDWLEDEYGWRAKRNGEDLRELFEEEIKSSERRKLEVINDFFNEFRYSRDINLWNKKDYWATPIEMLGKSSGDCEDYSIAKYFSLRQLGVSDDKLRITYVKYGKWGKYDQAHMVLAYYPTPDADPLILDNIDKWIVPASERDDLKPVYGFNGTDLWFSVGKKGDGQRVSSSKKIKKWTRVLAKFEREMRRS